MPNLLVEIGTEELPVGSLDVIYGELAAKNALEQEHLGGDVRLRVEPAREGDHLASGDVLARTEGVYDIARFVP